MTRLKELRKEKGLTQQQLAEKIGTTKLTVSNWENGKHVIKTSTAKELAELFNVNVEYLLGDSEFRNPFDLLLDSAGTELENGFKVFSQSDLNQIPFKKNFIKFLTAYDLALSNDDIDKVIDLIKLLSDTNKKILNNLVTNGDLKKLKELKDGDFSNLFTYSSNWSNKYNSLKNTDN
ncbi:helix-turn-helix domain-containing protein [Streptococcus sp. S2(2023)]|uniref:Helix-turn-helix domain-containing protein n=1 Tax=Streptococcus gingivalis TaxID=3111861 RepID=A0ABU6BB83_9STRE|nr:helix-turn-helix domain-containing protein [Streptococcus sp. S2(2023)]MEB3520920.1 helix-turn-helix domain-containing protein [Streptococcus sp. S2(2023)]